VNKMEKEVEKPKDGTCETNKNNTGRKGERAENMNDELSKHFKSLGERADKLQKKKPSSAHSEVNISRNALPK
jgi:hypothetical protein